MTFIEAEYMVVTCTSGTRDKRALEVAVRRNQRNTCITSVLDPFFSLAAD
jgi:hypothetical protein